MEEADAYQRLMDEFKLTQEQVAARVGKSRSAVANMLRLRQLPTTICDSLRNGELSMGHARALLAAGNAARQIAAWQLVRRKGLSVRQTEELIKQLNAEPPAKSRPAASS
jgi:ParB family chromosome partitioning protein